MGTPTADASVVVCGGGVGSAAGAVAAQLLQGGQTCRGSNPYSTSWTDNNKMQTRCAKVYLSKLLDLSKLLEVLQM